MATLVINETYTFVLHFANARIPKTAGQTWPVTIDAQESSSYDAGEALAYLDSASWPYEVTGEEKISRQTTNWNLVSDLSRLLTVKIYDYTDVTPGEVVPVPTEEGTIFISQTDWDRMTYDTLVDFWAQGTTPAAWTTTRLRMPLKLVCAIEQGFIKEPLKCEY